MSTDFQRLDCNNGCQLSRMQFLNEQQFLDMNAMLNNIQTDHLDLCYIMDRMVIPLLEYYAQRGDLTAQDALNELYDFV